MELIVSDKRAAGKRQEPGWEVSTVGDEFDIQLGKMLDRDKNSGTPKPYLGNKAVQWRRIDVDEISTMLMTDSDLARYQLREGDLLVCEGGEVGRAAIWDVPVDECYYQKALHRLRSLRGYDPRLLLAFLEFWTSRDYLSDYVSQTSIAHLTNQEKFAQVPLPVPNSREQEAIVTTLSDVDALIAALDTLIAKKRAIKTAAMQQLLTGKQRLPGFSGAWETKRLGEHLRFQVGFPFSSVHFNQEGQGLRLIKNRDLKADDQVFYYDGSYDSAFVVENDDVLIGMDGDFMPCIWNRGRALLNQRIGRIHAGSGLDLTFAYYALHEPLLQVQQSTSGTTVKHLSHGDVASIEIDLPPLPEQCAIADVLSDMDAEIGALDVRRAKTKQIKQGMMQELLTGRTRLVSSQQAEASAV